MGMLRSGGNIYNENIIKYSKRHKFSLTSIPVHGNQFQNEINCRLSNQYRLNIWDSLFIKAMSKQEITHQNSCLLAHYLPSQDPALSEAQCKQIEEQENRAIASVDFIIATGSILMQDLKTRYPDITVFLSEPGVGSPFLSPAKSTKKVGRKQRLELLTVANLLPSKGLLELQQILSILPASNWHWHLVGNDQVDSDFSNLFLKQAKSLGLSTQITLHGSLYQKKIAEFMNDIDIFISASSFEAYGMALAEAAAKGLPIISTQIGAATKLIEHGHTGFLVPPNACEKFALYLSQLMADAELRNRFRINLHAKKHRSWDAAFTDFKTACRVMLEYSAKLKANEPLHI